MNRKQIDKGKSTLIDFDETMLTALAEISLGKEHRAKILQFALDNLIGKEGLSFE